MSISRLTLAILTAATLTQAIAAPTKVGETTVTVSGTITPQACTLTIDKTNLSLGDATQVLGGSETSWVAFGDKPVLMATVDCKGAVAQSALHVVDPNNDRKPAATSSVAAFALLSGTKFAGGFNISITAPSVVGASGSPVVGRWDTVLAAREGKGGSVLGSAHLKSGSVIGLTSADAQPVASASSTVYQITIAASLYGNEVIEGNIAGAMQLELYMI